MSGADRADRPPLPPEALAAINSFAKAQRIDVILKAGRYTEAAQLAREALADDPENLILLNLLSLALLASHRDQEAREVAERAVSIKPDDAGALRNLGFATYRCGDSNKAAEIIDRSLALRPDDLTAVSLRADILIRDATSGRRSKKRRAELLAHADRLGRDAVQRHPDDAVGFLIRGKVALTHNDWMLASSLARQALAIEPENALGHQLLGLAAQLSGDTAAAADHFVSAGKLNPQGSSLTLLRKLRGAPLVGVFAGIVLTRIVLGAGAAIGGVVLAFVFAGILWAFLLYYPRWKARRSMSATARGVLERDRQLRGR